MSPQEKNNNKDRYAFVVNGCIARPATCNAKLETGTVFRDVAINLNGVYRCQGKDAAFGRQSSRDISRFERRLHNKNFKNVIGNKRNST